MPLIVWKNLHGADFFFPSVLCVTLLPSTGQRRGVGEKKNTIGGVSVLHQYVCSKSVEKKHCNETLTYYIYF